MKVRVVAYKGKIVIVPIDPEKGVEDGWYPTGRGRIGCVVLDTKKTLGVSEEAFELMRKVQRNRDAIGDISWWECDDGTHAFSWCGSIHRVISPEDAEGDRDFHVHNRLWAACTKIPNEVPEAAKLMIDQNPTTYAWAEPHDIP